MWVEVMYSSMKSSNNKTKLIVKDTNYNLSIIINSIKTNKDRMSFEPKEEKREDVIEFYRILEGSSTSQSRC